MKYESPICECGSKLEFIEEYVVDKIRKVNKNGMLSKKIKDGIGHSNGIFFLRCTKCNLWFDADYDEKDRLVRGKSR